MEILSGNTFKHRGYTIYLYKDNSWVATKEDKRIESTAFTKGSNSATALASAMREVERATYD